MAESLTDQFEGKLIDGLEFCRLAYLIYDDLRKKPDGMNALRERQRPIKRLVEEIFPICRYVQNFYGPGRFISVRWVEGQAYDAEIVASGQLIEVGEWPALGKLEVTQAVHKNEYLMRERLSKEGFAFGLDGLSRESFDDGSKRVKSVPTIHDNQSYIDEFVGIMLTAIAGKISKGYPPETTLIVDCVLNTIYLRSEWEALIQRVRARLPSHNFAQIFACSIVGNYSTII